MKKVTQGALTVDKSRGVVYFHDNGGVCLLRIEGLDAPDPGRQIDIRLRDQRRAKDSEGRLKTAEIVR